jgi:hypothetical protein
VFLAYNCLANYLNSNRRKRALFFYIQFVGGEELSKSTIKIGSSIMMAMAVFALVVSILWVSITEMMFVSDYLAYTGQSLSDAVAAGSKSAELWLTAKRLWGFELIGISVLIMFITARSYAKGERWSWYALLLAGCILWGSLIGYKVAIGYFQPTMSSMTFIVGAILFAIGITVPAKAILSKKST